MANSKIGEDSSVASRCLDLCVLLHIEIKEMEKATCLLCVVSTLFCRCAFKTRKFALKNFKVDIYERHLKAAIVPAAAAKRRISFSSFIYAW